MPIFTVSVTDLEFDHGQHYLKAKEMAEAGGYEEPFVFFDDQEFGPLLKTAAELAPARKPMVVVRLDGGLVQDVIASVPVEVLVADYDVEGMEDDRLNELPKLPCLDDEDGAEVPVACEVRAPFVDPEFAESLIRTARGDPDGDPSDDAAEPAMSTFTVFVQQADGRGTVHIADYEAATAADAAAAAIEQVSVDWGTESEPWDKDNLRVLGIAKGDIEIVEWNDIDY
ncbi:MAG: hypothetical protein EPN36_14435 [Rhodanobacteraceae bacterium]|nr:MAG: hypothetical protein EPN36_14435 [Rhodanobacteraceae bacterium]